MSTRCAIVFSKDGLESFYEVAVYKHSDGYPEGQKWLLDWVKEFVASRGADCEYAVAQLVRRWTLDNWDWDARRRAEKDTPGWVQIAYAPEKRRLEFTGMGVFRLREGQPERTHVALEYVYCVDLQKGGRIWWRRADTVKWTRLTGREK